MHGWFEKREQPSPVRPPSARRWFWLAMAALLLTGTGARPARPTSTLSKILQPVQNLAQKIAGAFTPPAKPPSNEINSERELVVRALAVTNDSRARGLGPWSFGHLMQNLAPAGKDPAEFAEEWMRLWIAAAGDNPDDFWTDPSDPEEYPDDQADDVRAASLEVFLSNWPRGANGKLDLAKAPFRLQGIINRLDIGEGRLSYCGVVANTAVYPDRKLGEVLDVAIIFEYELPPLGEDGTIQDAAWWANQWHQLAQHNIQSENYLNALQTLTGKFTVRGVSPHRTNGSALKSLRTNEQVSDLGFGIDTTPVWQFLGFQFAANGALQVEQLADTPHFNYERSACGDGGDGICQEELIDYLLENRAAILAGTWKLDPAQIQTATYGPVFPASFSWLADVETPDGLSDDDWEQLRLAFSNRTCNGCHGHGRGYSDRRLFPPHEFMQLSERDPMRPSVMSKFLEAQIQEVRIPNMLSYIAPQDARARRADPNRLAVH